MRITILTIFLFLSSINIQGQQANLHCLEQFWTLEGEFDGQDFGMKVVAGFDINLDSYQDILVKSWIPDPAMVEIFYGGEELWSHNNKVLLQYAPDSTGYWGSAIGYSISVEGDLNGDGYLDLVLGDQSNNRIYIYYADSLFGGEYDFIISIDSLTPWSQIPINISTNIDINGDGYDDIVAAPFDPTDNIRIYYGGPLLDSMCNLYISPPENLYDHYMGSPQAFVSGDFNADGFLDLANIYDYISDDYMKNLGLVVVSFGDNEGYNFSKEWHYFGIPGRSVQVQDFNNDGIDDLLAGGYGEALFFYGGIEFDTIPDFTFSRVGPLHDDQQFEYLHTDIDINGDGYDDYISSNHRYGRGMIFFDLGGPGNDGIHECTLRYPEGYSDEFGRSFTSVGDVNGDGIDDILVGDQGKNIWPVEPDGRISIYLGRGTIVDVVETIELPVDPEIVVYPNPSNSTVRIEINAGLENKISDISIYDIMGRTLEINRIVNQISNSNAELDFSAQSSGLYFISITLEDQQTAYFKKVLIIR